MYINSCLRRGGNLASKGGLYICFSQQKPMKHAKKEHKRAQKNDGKMKPMLKLLVTIITFCDVVICVMSRGNREEIHVTTYFK